jgi:hypothetical protein
MKNTNRNLDDLFAAARKEEPIMSEEKSRDLLRTGEQMQTTSFIFSTKGITMTTLGLSLAALIAYFAFNNAPQTNTLTKSGISAPVSHVTAHIQETNTTGQKNESEPVKKLTFIRKSDVTTAPPTLPALPQLLPLVSTPLKVEAVKPLPLAPEKYSSMGLTKKDNGTVTLSQKNENGHIFTMSFPQNSWGISIDDKDNISDAPFFGPLIVTDTKGNKRLMQFRSDVNGTKMRGMQITSRGEDEENDPAKITELINNAVNIETKMQIGGKDGDIDRLSVGLDSNQLNDLHDLIKMQIEQRLNDTASKENHKKMIVMKMNKTVHLDSAIKDAHEKVKHAQKEIKEVIVNLRLKDLDSNLKNMKIDENNIDINTNLEDLDLDLSAIEKHMNAFNDLIPVLVRNATSEHFDKHEGITYDDGLIFWYKPEKEVLSNLPASAESQIPAPVSNTIITKSMLFPNPAQNKTTIQFTLSEPRTIAFSIHDLLGKRLLDGGSIAESTAGNFEHEINISSLKAGVYLLVITTDKGEQTTQRLVIEK